jgi:hypothetical protein
LTTSKNGSNNVGWLALAGVIGLILAIGKCSGPTKTAQSFSSPSLANQVEAMAPVNAPVEPLAPAAVKLGASHLRAALSAEGMSGAMIYSQNCYDALTRDFSWSKLDKCGAVDMLSVRAVSSLDAEGLAAEITYFEPEAAAGRYLAAATKAGQDTAAADSRLEGLQRLAERAPLPVKKAVSKPTDEETPTTDDEDIEVDGNEAVDV